MKLDVVAVDDDGVGIVRREPAELAVDQLEPPDHVLGALMGPVPLADVLLDRVGVRRQHDDEIRVPRIADRQHLPELLVMLGRVLRDVRLERDPRTLEENDLAGTIVVGGVAIVGVVEPAEVGGDADRVAPGVDVLEHAGIPHPFLALAVRSVVVKVAELPEQRALADARPADDRDSHVRAFRGRFRGSRATR